MKCVNCDNEFVGAYCNVCGQRILERLTLKTSWKLIIDDVFDINKGLFFTVKQLWINPGKTSLDFIKGRTKNYYSPVKYLIFWTALYLVLMSFIDSGRQSESIRDLIFNSTPPFSFKSFGEYMTIYNEILFRHTDLFYLGLTPFLTLTSHIIYRKKKFYLAELSVLYLYILGQIIFILACVVPMLSLFGENRAVLIFIAPLAMVVIYLVIKSHKQFFGETWIKSIVKGLTILYVGQILYGLTTYITLNLVKMI